MLKFSVTMRVFVAQLNPIIGDVEGNTQKVLEGLRRAKQAKADIVLFSELVLSGYPPEDLLLERAFIDAIQKKLEIIEPATAGLFAVVGLPRWNPTIYEKPLFNSAAVFVDGKLLGFKNKTLLPTYDVFDESRFFERGKDEPIWEYLGRRIGVTICEDLWQHAQGVRDTKYALDPVCLLKQGGGVDLLLNLSSSPYCYGRKESRLSIFSAAAKTLKCPLFFCNQVGANDELIFDGNSLYLNEKGELLLKGASFREDDLIADLEPLVCTYGAPESGIGELYEALLLGVRDYFRKQNFQKALLGLSGGIDSALVACISADALGAENVCAINMPSRYSSAEGICDAELVAKNLGIEFKRIEIDEIFENYRHLLGADLSHLTEENLQPRIRAIILMALSNETGALLLSTGNKTEMAMGYTTLYGDLCGALGVLQDVTKLRVYELARYVNREQMRIPETVLQRAPSPELRPDHKTADSLPDFAILDPILEDYLELRLSLEEIAERHRVEIGFVRELIHRVHSQEYKRRQAPIGLRVTQKAFSKGRNVPIVQKWV